MNYACPHCQLSPVKVCCSYMLLYILELAPRVVISKLGEDGGLLFEGGGDYLIEGGHLFHFS